MILLHTLYLILLKT